jgi:uncharacterized protein
MRRTIDGAVGGAEAPAVPAAARAARQLAVLPIRLYQLVISPLLPANTCKYHPSCSEYAVLAIRKYGVFKGIVLAAWRLLRCNPWSHGGVDHP